MAIKVLRSGSLVLFEKDGELKKFPANRIWYKSTISSPKKYTFYIIDNLNNSLYQEEYTEFTDFDDNPFISETEFEGYVDYLLTDGGYEDLFAINAFDRNQIFHKFGFNTDVDIGSEELVSSFGGVFDPTTDVMTTAQTFTITYDPLLDGEGTTGATQLQFDYLDANNNRQTGLHILGSTGTDVTSFTGLGINRCNLIANGGLGRNAGNITITATTDGTTQAQIPLGIDGDGVSVTEQLLLHTPINYYYLLKGIEINCIRLAGGTSPRLSIYIYSWSRVTETRYRIFSRRVDTSVRNDITINFGDTPLIFGGREVIYMAVTSDQNNTIFNGRFYGKLIEAIG